MRDARRHELLMRTPDVLHGAAGYGLACLRFWVDGLGGEFLDEAVRVGDHLMTSCADGSGGAHWRDQNGDIPLGYARGGSGIALFLLMLHRATGDERPLATGRSALGFDLGHAVWQGEELAGFPALMPEDVPPELIVPRCYWDSGSAGILTTLVRYLTVTPDDGELRGRLAPLVGNVSHKYAAFPQLFHGLAGMGNALIDVWRLTGDGRCLDAAWRTAEGVLLFRVDRPEGAGFPGEQVGRESADFATGTAGVALFLDRLLGSGTGRRDNFNFVVDELLPGYGDSVSHGRGVRRG